MRLYTNGTSKFIDTVYIAAAAAAKGEIFTRIQAAHAKAWQHRLDKAHRIGTPQFIVKSDMDDPVNTKPGNQPVIFGPVGKMKGRIILSEKLSWMRVKCDNGSIKPLFTRSSNGGADHLLVTFMYPVKIANGRDPCLLVDRLIANRPFDYFRCWCFMIRHGAALYR
jgi:hypothetical protein